MIYAPGIELVGNAELDFELVFNELLVDEVAFEDGRTEEVNGTELVFAVELIFKLELDWTEVLLLDAVTFVVVDFLEVDLLIELVCPEELEVVDAGW